MLDLRRSAQPGQGILVEALQRAIDANGVTIASGSAVLLRTGPQRYGIGDDEFYRYAGMTRAGDAAPELAADRSAWDGGARDRPQPGESLGAPQVRADR